MQQANSNTVGAGFEEGREIHIHGGEFPLTASLTPPLPLLSSIEEHNHLSQP